MATGAETVVETVATAVGTAEAIDLYLETVVTVTKEDAHSEAVMVGEDGVDMKVPMGLAVMEVSYTNLIISGRDYKLD